MLNRNFDLLQKLISVFSIIFGIATLVASARILYLDADPGYVAFIPLLIFNHIMGFIYIGAGYLIWKNKQKGKTAALMILLVNLVALVIVGVLYVFEGGVAIDSIGAMLFRTIIWALIFIVLKVNIK